MRIGKLVAVALATSGLVLGALSAARAIPTVEISDGTTTITVADQQVGPPTDSNSAVGNVVWTGSVGNWTFTLAAGQTKPALGSATDPQLDLTFAATSTLAAPETLTIKFSEINYTAFVGGTLGVDAMVNGNTPTAPSNVVYNTYLGTDNLLFSQTTLLTSQTFTTPPAGFGGDISGSANPGAAYSLTQVIKVTHQTGSGITTTGDASLTTVPEPASMLLLGSGMAAVGILRRRRRGE